VEFQGDGNLVAYEEGPKAINATGTTAGHQQTKHLALRDDGRLVLTSALGEVVWEAERRFLTETSGEGVWVWVSGFVPRLAVSTALPSLVKECSFWVWSKVSIGVGSPWFLVRGKGSRWVSRKWVIDAVLLVETKVRGFMLVQARWLFTDKDLLASPVSLNNGLQWLLLTAKWFLYIIRATPGFLVSAGDRNPTRN
jgi:hypothetical protein